MEINDWISTNETAKTFFTRLSSQQPPPLRPPLHRHSLRPGNVIEIVGPSPSSKSHILLQVVVDCILPKEWKGVSYGGFELSVLFIDLDCRFDFSRLLQLLKLRIFSVNGSSVELKNGLHDVMDWICDDELIQKCLERFQYIRCYDSFEFLAALKTLTYQCRTKRKDISKVRFIMIDSIGAYYWVDRASTSLPLGSNCRKMISLQSITEAVVREMRNILLEQPMLVFATKATIFGDKYVSNDIYRKWPPQDAYGQSSMGKGQDHMPHREYMPSAWQSFVTHRMYVRPSNTPNEQIYSAQWLLPPLPFTDKFVIRDAGIYTIP